MSALRKAFCVSLLGLVACSAVFGNVLAGPRVEFRQFFALGQHGRVTVDNRYGNVSIVAWDRDDVLVEAVKHSSDPRRVEQARIVVEPAEGALSIRTQYAGSATDRPAKVEYRISVPRSTNLENVRLGNGGLTISGVAGPVRASSVNGNIHAQRLEGQTELSTVNGQLEADFPCVHAAQGIVLKSVNGPIRLVIPGGARPNVSARNVSGGIESEIGHATRVEGAQQLVVHGGGAKIRLDNINGGISIHSTWSRHGSAGTEF
ncbi:MAG TPA: hypothetical protein VHW24_28305 [Bryobacteraceae bacterium]|jgi:DUF4097 and DUF4098 domain-containing protein YvlB|nr:hypothetical protein [Bryobacteraceae bacterium]